MSFWTNSETAMSGKGTAVTSPVLSLAHLTYDAVTDTASPSTAPTTTPARWALQEDGTYLLEPGAPMDDSAAIVARGNTLTVIE